MRWLALPSLFLVCAFAIGVSGGSACAGPITLRIMLWGSPQETEAPRRQEAPPIARYVPDQGEIFVLDRSTNPPLLRFEDSPEIWILQSQPGPRGDTIYRNDIGQPVLRATKLGGLTLFTADNPDGVAAAFDGEATSLRLPPFMSPGALLQRLVQASLRSGHAAQRSIYFGTADTPKDDATPETAALVAETAIVTAEAINRISRMSNGRTALTPVVKVLLARGRKPDAQLSSGALTVTYVPNGAAGEWPSSERILRTIISTGPSLMRVKR